VFGVGSELKGVIEMGRKCECRRTKRKEMVNNTGERCVCVRKEEIRNKR